MALLCKCMNMACTNEHADPIRVILADGVPVARQDFVVPEGAYPVRMQVGQLPVTIIGWIDDSASLPNLLRDIAKELEKVMSERAED